MSNLHVDTDCIRYQFFNNHKSTLAVILPGASLLPRSHDRFIRLLSKKANVLLIKDGYFGLRLLDSQNPMCKASSHLVWNSLDTSVHMKNYNHITDFNRTSFCKNLHQLIHKFPHKKLVFLTSSVGTIHGLTYALNYPGEVDTIVLAALPIGSKLLNYTLFVSTHLLLSTSPDRLLSYILKFYGIISKTKKVAAVMERTRKNIGARTYLLCLKEIAIFSIWYKKGYEELIARKNSPRTIIIAGVDDPIFNRYCNTPMCRKAFAIYRVPARHAPFVEAPNETYKLIENELT